MRGAHGSCIDPVSIGAHVVVFRDGMWRGPEMTEEQKIKAFGHRPGNPFV
jgi:hypothetical protein